MRSLLFKIPFWLPLVGHFDIPVHAYGTMLVIGMFAALLLGKRLFRDLGLRIPGTQVMDMAVAGVVAGVVGARLLYILQNLNAFARDPVSVFRVWEGGLSFHGGVVGGAIGIIWFLRRHKLPVLKVGDVIMPCLLLGLGWGRIGCFMNGCCYGKVCKDLPWAVTFPEGSPAYLWHLESGLIGDHAARCLPVHPVQVYSSISAVGLALFLVWVLSRKRFDGEVMVCAAGTYGVLRFLLEFLRDDDSPILAGLTQSQLFSIGLLALGILLYWTLRPREAGA